MIDDIVDESGQVKDNASDELQSIRMNLYRKRMNCEKYLTG
jgi:DNA mismatch repair protein MutS2